MSKDISGERFGKLVVLKEVERQNPKKRRWLCICDCGNKKEFNHTRLTCSNEPSRSCGCLIPSIKDLTGQKFNRLTVLNFNKQKNKPAWLCQCDCGKEITINHHRILSGHTKSCGCLQLEKSKTHGKTETVLYRRWTAIKSRCNYPNNKYYYNYGGRGIKLLWNSFEEFESDMGASFKPELSIDRIDNDGHYCKENCRWVDRQTQNYNKRNNHYLKYKNKTQTITEWAIQYKMNPGALTSRLRRGWSLKDALTRKPRERGFGVKINTVTPSDFPGTVGHRQG